MRSGTPRAAVAAGAVVAALAAAAVAATPEVHTLAGGPFEASGAVHVPGTDTLLFVDDGRPDAVLSIKLGPDGRPTGAPTVVPLGVSVVDPEGITTDGTHVYVVGSQSRGGARRDGAGLVRFRYDAAAGRVADVQSIGGLSALLGQKVPELQAGAGAREGGKKKKKENKEAALNIEGLAWDPGGGRLLLGLRSPLADGRHAMVVPLKLGAFTAEAVEVQPAVHIDLGGAGIRSIEYDATAGAFRVIAGGVENAGTFRLVEWSGQGPQVRELATFPDGLKPEGVARAAVGNRPPTLVLCDSGRYLVMD